MNDSYWGLLFIDKQKKKIITIRIPTALAGGAEDCYNCVSKDKAKFMVDRYVDEYLGNKVRLTLVGG